jgi:hypothetical protein
MFHKSRGVFFLRSPKRLRQPPHICTLLGDPKPTTICKIVYQTLKINKTYQIHTPKIQGRIFSEIGEETQAATTDAPSWETLKPQKKCLKAIPNIENRGNV